MAHIELAIPEERLDEFEAWFTENCSPPAKADVVSFSRSRGKEAVAFRVIVTGASEGEAVSIKAVWG